MNKEDLVYILSNTTSTWSVEMNKMIGSIREVQDVCTNGVNVLDDEGFPWGFALRDVQLINKFNIKYNDEVINTSIINANYVFGTTTT